MFDNPYWYALSTEQATLAIGSETVRRYPADVIPFAGMSDSNSESLEALHDLLAPDESILVTGKSFAQFSGLEHTDQERAWQMHLPGTSVPAQDEDAALPRELGAADAPAMVQLTDVAFPHYFRPRAYILGSYFGVEQDGMLVAMAGERLALPGYREISAVCTHPAYTGRGYAATLVRHLVRLHASTGLHSFLHVSAANERALRLYEYLGFVKARPLFFNLMRRVP